MAVRVRKSHFLIALFVGWFNDLRRDLFGASFIQQSYQTFYDNLGALPAPASLHASIASGAFDVTTAFSPMPYPRRSVQAVYGTGTAAHTLEITGTDPRNPMGPPLVVNVAISGPGTFDSGKGFASITRVRSLTAPGGAARVSGGALQLNTGLAFVPPHDIGNGQSMLLVNGLEEDPASYDNQTGAVTPATPIDGTATFAVTGGTSTGGPAFAHLDKGNVNVTAANATNLSTAQTLVKALLTSYAAHRVDTLAHLAADSTNTVASAPADVVDQATAITAVNQLKAAFNNHPMQMGVHASMNGGVFVGTMDASDLTSLQNLANDLKAAFNTHAANAPTSEAFIVDGL